jgi:pimeloyl-ACP methyl ester carboxylesterase
MIKSLLVKVIRPLSALVAFTALAQPQNQTGAAGYWEGAITLPATSLEIRVELERDGTQWKGAITIPVQGLRNFGLTNIAVRGTGVVFVMSGIPGDPQFKGTLAADAKTISGDFTQGGQTFPFKLERKAVQPKHAGETPAKGVPGKGLAGVWQGSLKVSVIELRLVIKISKSGDGKLAGTLDSVDQGAKDMPIDSIDYKDNAVHLELKKIGGTYDGKMSEDGSEITGDWKQGGQTLPLVFKRLEKAPELGRLQEPKKPYPYREQEAEFENKKAGIKLGGTLTLPRARGPFPAVLLITGSGAQDRDEAIMGHRPFFVLADHLTRRGIAVLRVDDRGVGKSTGDFSQATTEDFVEDALAGFEFLKRHGEVDAKRIGLIGHSEGGIVAPLVAVKSPEVAFIVLMAGVGVPMDELLVRQGADIARVMGAQEAMITKSSETQKRTFQIIREEADAAVAEKRIRELVSEQLAELTDDQKKALGISDAMIAGQVRMATSPWFRWLLAYDPGPTLMKVKCPVLAINGEKDIQVAAKENLSAIRAALEAGKNKDFEAVELPGLNHLFQTCRTGAVAEYGQIEETIAPAALEKMSTWILKHVGK